MGKILRKTACDSCGSSNNRCEYDDGSAWCFTPDCESNKKAFKNQIKEEESNVVSFDSLPFGTSAERNISTKVCEMFGVKREVSSSGGTSAVYYPYYENNVVVGNKKRLFPKDFRVEGKLPLTLFGQNVFPGGGKRIVITEGEEDTLAVAEAYAKYNTGIIYPVVSIPSASNLKAVVENRDYLRSFEEVILFIDTDEAGDIAVDKLANAIGFDKVKVARTALKDASQALTEVGHMGVLRGIWDSQPYSPQGICTGEDLWTKLVEYNDVESQPYPECFSGLNDKIKGMRMGEIALWVSGTGAGKSTMLREIVLDLIDSTQDKVGIIALEESPAETTRKLAGMAIRRNPAAEKIPLEDLRVGFDTFGDRVMVLDHCGSMSNGIISQLEYMALSGCKYLFIDHITILVSEGSDGLTGNEAIDKVMNDLLRISKQHNVWIGLVSHLRKMSTSGQSFEEGRLPTVDDIRGSGSIKQISHDILAFARNITADSEDERNTITLSVLKSRYTGKTGPAGTCKYEYDTGRLHDGLYDSMLGNLGI
jgi:twinkle protein